MRVCYNVSNCVFLRKKNWKRTLTVLFLHGPNQLRKFNIPGIVFLWMPFSRDRTTTLCRKNATKPYAIKFYFSNGHRSYGECDLVVYDCRDEVKPSNIVIEQ